MNGAILVVGTFEFPATGVGAVLDAIAPHVTTIRQSPGCELYAWMADPLVAERMHALERWSSEEQLLEHLRGPLFAKMRTALRSQGPIVASSRKYRVAAEGPVLMPDGSPAALL